jgi:hypothetical protein
MSELNNTTPTLLGQMVNGIAQNGFVYLIQPVGHNVYKIGSSINVDQRLKQLQTRTTLTLVCVASIRYFNHSSAESMWHSRFKQYHLSGDWFALPNSAVKYFKATSK